jgi:hypothetical protein
MNAAEWLAALDDAIRRLERADATANDVTDLDPLAHGSRALPLRGWRTADRWP